VCSGASCGRGSLIQSNSGSCNGVYWNGVPEVCPIVSVTPTPTPTTAPGGQTCTVNPAGAGSCTSDSQCPNFCSSYNNGNYEYQKCDPVNKCCYILSDDKFSSICTTAPTPTPAPTTCTRSDGCNGIPFCNGCDQYNSVCSGSECIQGTTLLNSNTTLCNNVGTNGPNSCPSSNPNPNPTPTPAPQPAVSSGIIYVIRDDRGRCPAPNSNDSSQSGLATTAEIGSSPNSWTQTAQFFGTSYYIYPYQHGYAYQFAGPLPVKLNIPSGYLTENCPDYYNGMSIPTVTSNPFEMSFSVSVSTTTYDWYLRKGYNVSGKVYVDQVDNPYSSGATITICSGKQPDGCDTNPYETLTTAGNGTFTTVGAEALLPGNYTAILTVPSGYQAVLPRPPIAVFTVGTSCSTTLSGSSCDPNGNVINLNFDITNATPWMQVIGGDITGNYISNPVGGGFTDAIPVPAGVATGACSANGAYAMVSGSGGGTHGLINVGSGGKNFGQGQEAAAATNWLVGGLGAGSYPYVYNMPLSKQTRTSYANLSYEIQQSNVPTTPLNSIQNWNGCSDYSNCTLPTDPTIFKSGVYTIGDVNTIKDLTLTGTDGTYTFPTGGSYVILVNGVLNINTKIIVPNGSFVLFSAADNINVASTVGETTFSTACTPATTTNGVSSGCDLEGFYSTDKSFTALGQGTNGNASDCSGTADLRLNVAGAIVVNAVTTNNGGFYYKNRDLCSNDQFCPVFTITERPDFVLSTPPFVMFPRRTWQEVAP